MDGLTGVLDWSLDEAELDEKSSNVHWSDLIFDTYTKKCQKSEK